MEDLSDHNSVHLIDDGYGATVTRILQSDQYLSGDNFLKSAASYPNVTYRKLEFLNRFGQWRGQFILPGLIEAALPAKRTVVYGHSSAAPAMWVDVWIRYLMRKNLVGTNRAMGVRGQGIPLGLTNFSPDSEIHMLFGDTKPIVDVVNTEKSFKYEGHFYANFDPSTHPTRIALAQFLDRVGFPRSEPTRSVTGRRKYLQECRNADFVLCPPGVGEDTHRLWESIYVGTVPIVLRSAVMEFLAQFFPICLLDSWDELLDDSHMREMHDVLMVKAWDGRRLKVSSWLEEVASMH